MSPAYLLEFFAPKTQNLFEANVFRCPQTAVAEAVQYCLSLATECPVTSVDVTKEDDELEGIAFLSEDGLLLACLTRYHLEAEPLKDGPYDFGKSPFDLQSQLLSDLSTL